MESLSSLALTNVLLFLILMVLLVIGERLGSFRELTEADHRNVLTCAMTDRVRLIKHEVIPGCGSFEVRFPDGRESVYFYWDDLPSRRLRPETLDRETALEQAKAVARAADARALGSRKPTAK